MVAQRMLETFGCHVDTASNGKEAIEQYQQKDYDLIFMDCQMPEMDGYEATKIIRSFEQRGGPHVPIVALTANALEGDRDTCLAAGMDEYLGKPFRRDELKRVLLAFAGQAVVDRSMVEWDDPSAPLHKETLSVMEDQKTTIAQLDRDAVDSLKELAGDDDPDFFVELVDKYLTTGQNLFSELAEAIRFGDQQRIFSLGHQMKSNSANFGATDLSELCAWLEKTAKAGDAIPPEMADELIESFHAVKRALEIEISTLAS
jgi:CheY-like chemotaxis protein